MSDMLEQNVSFKKYVRVKIIIDSIMFILLGVMMYTLIYFKANFKNEISLKEAEMRVKEANKEIHEAIKQTEKEFWIRKEADRQDSMFKAEILLNRKELIEIKKTNEKAINEVRIFRNFDSAQLQSAYANLPRAKGN